MESPKSHEVVVVPLKSPTSNEISWNKNLVKGKTSIILFLFFSPLLFEKKLRLHACVSVRLNKHLEEARVILGAALWITVAVFPLFFSNGVFQPTALHHLGFFQSYTEYYPRDVFFFWMKLLEVDLTYVTYVRKKCRYTEICNIPCFKSSYIPIQE